jgi:hypothetical protein
MPGEVLVRFYGMERKRLLERMLPSVPPRGDIVHIDGRPWLVHGAEWFLVPELAVSVVIEKLETEEEEKARLDRARSLLRPGKAVEP